MDKTTTSIIMFKKLFEVHYMPLQFEFVVDMEYPVPFMACFRLALDSLPALDST